jgi:N-acetylglucosaminyldiphosphoundecaprenol N-acetyl-beta-D-mannosaminyltransferase
VIVADGMPVVWASGLLGHPLPGRVTGVDLMEAVCSSLQSRRASVFLLGGTEHSVIRAAEALPERYPGLRIAGRHHGFFGPGEAGDVRLQVNHSGADALFVGMGSPLQERWVAQNLEELEPSLIMCLGGAIDVVAGIRTRAPRWMQKSGLEWAFRLFQDPGRLWRRYLVDDMAFVRIFVHEWRTSRREHAA